MQLRNRFNKGFQFYVIDTYSKYAWVIPLKDKKGIAITNAFQKIVVEPGHKPNKTWVDEGSEFYKKPMKFWLQDNDIQHIMKEKLLLLKDLLEPLRKKFISI